ncbi:d353dc51-b741-43ec-8574-4609fa85c38d [Sclerotinia trifoliorum]|uniref:D353dc51-b741-43ec-8574-4609fa85c38d n=1 Tax=Sclerotinia trifoliorum TaxID=28548 RepID=A0A8H2ZL58_9HELO|nr:d353dc51-b741-43ec-8574-4609fa85c38d [Sclerotinia trifoliorum]
MNFASKSKTIEGHTKYISVKVGDNVVLDKPSTHDNMHDFVVSVTAILATLG